MRAEERVMNQSLSISPIKPDSAIGDVVHIDESVVILMQREPGESEQQETRPQQTMRIVTHDALDECRAGSGVILVDAYRRVNRQR